MECGGTLDVDADGFLYTDGVLPTFTIDIDPDGRAALPTLPTDDPGEDVHATFGYGGESWDVGLHLKGHSSFRPIDEKAAFKIDFHEWERDQTFFGVRRLTLNNMVGDPSMIAEELGYRLYAAMGVPAARHGYACLVVDGAPYGLYGVLETMDEQFVERAFDDPTGNLYEGTFGADFRPALATNFILQEEGDTEPFTDTMDLANALEETADADILDFFDAHFDRDALFHAWATELVIGNIDGYLSRGNNFLVYHEPGPDRWWMLPWGMDEVFDDPVDVHAPEYEDDDKDTRGLLYVRCALSQPCLDALDVAIGDVVDTMVDQRLHTQAVALINQIAEVSRADAMSPAGPIDTAAKQNGVADFIAGRPGKVRRMLRE